MTSIESKLDSLLDVYRQVLQKGPSGLTLASLPLFELENHQHHNSDYQTSMIGRELPSPQGGNLERGGGEGNRGLRRSQGTNPRGLRLILAPADDDIPPDSAPPSYPPSTASLSPSPLLPPDSPYPTLVTPNGTSKRAHFPDLPPPPASSGGFTLQLPSMVPPSHLRYSAHSIADDLAEGVMADKENLGPSVVTESSLGADRVEDAEAVPVQGGVQLRDKPCLKNEAVWRRHMSLEVNPLLLLSSSTDGTPSDWDGGLGKSLSVHNLSQTLSSHGDLSNWDGTELFIGECKLEPAEKKCFNFLSPDGSPADLLQTVQEAAPPSKGSQDFLSQSTYTTGITIHSHTH